MSGTISVTRDDLAEALRYFEGMKLKAIARRGFACAYFGDWVETSSNRPGTFYATPADIKIECACRLVTSDGVVDPLERISETDGIDDSIRKAVRQYQQLLEEDKLAFKSWELGPGGLLSVDLGMSYVLQAIPNRPHDTFHWAVALEDPKTAIYCVGPDCRLESWL